VVVVKPKQPFLDWCRLVIDDPGMSLDDVTIEPGTYLLPDYDDEGVEAFLRSFFEEIFEHELEGWIVDETYWPKNRDFERFLEWFDVELSSIVVDLAEEPLEYDDG